MEPSQVIDISSAQDAEDDSESESSISRSNSTKMMVTSESVQSDTSSVTSLLDRLRYPTLSILARKRQLKHNPPPKGVKWGKGKEKGDPKNISASERVKAYPDEQLTVSNRKLFCHACREELATKKSSIESHVKSQKHTKGKEAGIEEQGRIQHCTSL